MGSAVIYCRVSTKEQTRNLSLPTQERACRDFCERNQIKIVESFVEEGESAKTADRVELKKLLEYCRKYQDELDYLVVYAISRFSRNQYDHVVMKSMLMQYGITLRSVTEPIDDTSTGKLMEGILSAFSQFDNDIRSERTVAGMKAAIEAGRWPFQPALGYSNGIDDFGQKNIVPDPDTAPLVRKAFKLIATGLYTETQVREKVNSLGLQTRFGRPVSGQTFNKLIQNPLYAGWIAVEGWGEPRRGRFKPLIDQATYDEVQAFITGRNISVTPHKRNNPDFPLRLFVRCGSCKKPLTGSWSKGRSKKYPYYRCRNHLCKAVSLRRDQLDCKWGNHLKALQLRTEYLPLFREIVLDLWKSRQAETTELRRVLTEKLSRLKKHKQKLVEAFLYEQSIPQEVYKEEEHRLKEKILLTEMDLHQVKLEELDIEGILAFAEYLLSNLARLWIDLPLEQKQRLQKIVYPNGITFLDGEFGTAETSPVFNLLGEFAATESTVVAPTGVEPVFPP